MFRSLNIFLLVVASQSACNLSFAQSQAAHTTTPTRSGFSIHEQAPDGLSDVYDFYKSNFGFVPNLAKVMANSPPLLRSYVDTQNHLKTSASPESGGDQRGADGYRG